MAYLSAIGNLKESLRGVALSPSSAIADPRQLALSARTEHWACLSQELNAIFGPGAGSATRSFASCEKLAAEDEPGEISKRVHLIEGPNASTAYSRF